MAKQCAYQQKDGFIAFKYGRRELGRLYCEGGKWHWRPAGCEGKIRSEEFNTLQQLKNYLEGRETTDNLEGKND